jgi:hypothetical protein
MADNGRGIRAMTVDEADLKAEMHSAIMVWFEQPIATRPSSFALRERIRNIALKADATTTMTG